MTLAFFLMLSTAVGLSCTADPVSQEQGIDEDSASLSSFVLTLPALNEKTEEGKLRVVATTSILGDIISNVGGQAIKLTVLMAPGQDPHSFIPSAGELTSVSQAQVIFINGWDLEEGFIDTLANASENIPIVPISAGITPLVSGYSSAVNKQASTTQPDPHVWLDPWLVKRWVENVTDVLGILDPENAAAYKANASTYQQDLDALIQYYEEQAGTIPLDQRKIVTNHDSLSYFAAAYDFEIIGTVIPSASTLADPSSSDLADLIQMMELNGICAIFSESTTSDQLAETAVQEISSCDEVEVIPLYTGALGPFGSGAETYIDMMRANIDALVQGIHFSTK